MKISRLRMIMSGVALTVATVVTGAAVLPLTTEVPGDPIAWSDTIGPAGSAAVEQTDADPAEDDYLILVHRELPNATDAELIFAGHVACDSLDAVDPEDRSITGLAIGLTVTWPEWSMYQAGYVIGAAIVAWCPEYAYLAGG